MLTKRQWKLLLYLRLHKEPQHWRTLCKVLHVNQYELEAILTDLTARDPRYIFDTGTEEYSSGKYQITEYGKSALFQHISQWVVLIGAFSSILVLALDWLSNCYR